MDAASLCENFILSLKEKRCPQEQVPWALGTCERQVGSPQPLRPWAHRGGEAAAQPHLQALRSLGL